MSADLVSGASTETPEAHPHERQSPGSQYGNGWLAAVVLADARRFRVGDPALAATLADAGAECVEQAADVEIVSQAGELQGEAPLAIVAVSPPPPRDDAPPSVVRAGQRVVTSMRTRSRAAAARRRLRRAGYGDTSVLHWDIARLTRLAGLAVPRRRLADVLSTRALAIGRRTKPEPTALDAVLAEASRLSRQELRLHWVSIRSGVLVAGAGAGILRVAVGPARVQIASQSTALEALRDGAPPPEVERRIPRLLARGRTGLADWSLEQLLPGERPPSALSDALAAECREFLVALHRTPGGERGGDSHADLVREVVTVCGPEGERRARALAARLDSELAGIPRGFGHGDFFAGNLLAADNRLTGVLDWDAAGPGRPPLVDLLHLELTSSRYGGDNDWGPAVLERLLPLAAAGGNAGIQDYCRELELEPEPRLLEALVLGYWLGYAAYQLRTHPARRSEPLWIARNVEGVLQQVEGLVE